MEEFESIIKDIVENSEEYKGKWSKLFKNIYR